MRLLPGIRASTEAFEYFIRRVFVKNYVFRIGFPGGNCFILSSAGGSFVAGKGRAVFFAFLLSAAGLRSGQTPTISGGANQSSQAPEQRCVVWGKVTNLQTGEPLKKAMVHLRGHARQGRPTADGYVDTSEADGSFRFENVASGEYSLSGDRSGFIMTTYGARTSFSQGTNLTLSPGQETGNLTLALAPQGVIAGKVTDEEGDLMDQVSVVALQRVWNRGKAQFQPAGFAMTDDLGEFRLSGLRAGRYSVMAKREENQMGKEAPGNPQKPEIRPVATYYPDAMSLETATALSVSAGQVVDGTDIRLRWLPTHHVRGKVEGNLPQNSQVAINITPEDGVHGFFFGGMNFTTDRKFDVAGVAPGDYLLTANSMGRSLSSLLARQRLEVGAADVNGVVLTVVALADLHGQVEIDAGNGATPVTLKSLMVFLNATGPGNMAGGMSADGVKEDGSFLIKEVGPTRYDVNVNNLPDGYYLKALSFGQQDILGKELDLTQGVAGDLKITIRAGSPEVGGILKTDEKDHGDVTVALAPEIANEDGSGLRSVGTDQDGKFSFKGPRPGKYRLFAIQGVHRNDLENPDLLKEFTSRGVEVELAEHDRKQIELPLIAPDDVRQVLTQLGLGNE